MRDYGIPLRNYGSSPCIPIATRGNIRRVTIKNKEGKTLIEMPLTLGVVDAVLLPTLAAIGAIAALVTECTIVVEKIEE